jgi:hypothetical protein
MRHLWSFIAVAVAAPLAWLLLATGQHRAEATVAGWSEANFFDTADLIGPGAFLAGAGVLLGLVGTLRWSPVGPLVAGLLLIAPTILMFIDPFETLDAFSVGDPWRILDQDLQPWLPVQNGTLLVLGALLLVAVFSRQRWRRWPEQPIVAAAAPVYGDQVVPPPPPEPSEPEAAAEPETSDTGETREYHETREGPATVAAESAEPEPEAEPATEQEHTRS